MADELLVLRRSGDLLAWLLPKAERFPRVYRHTLTPRLLGAAMDTLDALYAAQAHRAGRRLEALADADASLNRLRAYLRLIYSWRWLNDGQFRHVSAMVAETGRLLGGWLKSERAKRSARE